MCHIHDLVDDNLEMIFKKLPHHDRLICKEVCQRWYNYLSESYVFREDRHIYLTRHCQIDEMISNFEAAKGSFEKLTIGDVVKTDGFSAFAKLLAAKGLKEVCFRNTSYLEIQKILPVVTFVESLNFEIHRNQPNIRFEHSKFFFENLKRIVIIYEYIYSSDFGGFIDNELPALEKMIPQEVVINIKIIELKFQSWTQRLTDAVNSPNMKVHVVYTTIYAEIFSAEQLLEFMNCNLPFERLEITRPEELAMDLEELLNGLEYKELCLNFFRLPNLGTLRSITMQNARKLTELMIGDLQCDLVHESLNFPSLLKLPLCGYLSHRSQCNECFDAILNSSMPKLRELDLTINDPQYVLFLRNWENLESLQLQLCKFNPTEMFRHSLPSLKEIFIHVRDEESLDITVEAFEKMGKFCPKLREFNLNCKVNISPSLEHLKETLANGFEDLKEFKLSNYRQSLKFLKESGKVTMKC